VRRLTCGRICHYLRLWIVVRAFNALNNRTYEAHQNSSSTKMRRKTTITLSDSGRIDNGTAGEVAPSLIVILRITLIKWPVEHETDAGKGMARITEARSKENLDVLCSPATNNAFRLVGKSRKVDTTYNKTILSGRATYTPITCLENHHNNVLHGPLEDMQSGDSYVTFSESKQHRRLTDSALNLPGPSRTRTRSLSLTEYWSEESWAQFTTSAPVPLSDIVAALGLKIRSLASVDVINHVTGSKLNKEIDRISSQLYGQLCTKHLVVAAADSDFLDKESDVLLDEYAPSIWGMDTDRSQLSRAKSGGLYAKDLRYEDDEDRKLLWLHLHQWIFARAFERLRTFGDTSAARTGMLGALQRQSSVPGHMFTVLDRAFGSAVLSSIKKQAKNGVARQASPASPTVIEVATPPTEASRRSTRKRRRSTMIISPVQRKKRKPSTPPPSHSRRPS
jgi:hypothetical protein